MQKIDIRRKLLESHLEKLVSFSVVAQEGSVSRAAAKLNISQSALSHQLGILSESLDLKLFERQSRGLKLTVAGERLNFLARRIREETSEFSKYGWESDVAQPLILRAATHETLAAHIWPQYLKILKDKMPNLNLGLDSARVSEMMSGLIKKEYDFVTSVLPKKDKRIVAKPIYGGYMQFYVSPKLKLPLEVSRQEIFHLPIYTDFGANIKQGESIIQTLLKMGMSHFGRFAIESFDASVNMASAGLGIVFIGDRNAAPAVKEKKIRLLRVRDVTEHKNLQYQIVGSRLVNHAKADEIDRVIGLLAELSLA